MDLKILNTVTAKDAMKVCDHKFKNGHLVPVYDIRNISLLNQLIGHAKYINKDYGNVYYRGVDDLYDNVKPALIRSKEKEECKKAIKVVPNGLKNLIHNISVDDNLRKSLKLKDKVFVKSKKEIIYNNKIDRFNKYIIEGCLQHYIGKTTFLDVVDNHWVALWMGLHHFYNVGGSKIYRTSDKREHIDDVFEEYFNNGKSKDDVKKNIYLYLMLLAMPHASEQEEYGITETKQFVEVDLRKALPSTFLRPHSQHALVIKRRDSEIEEGKSYDMASQVVGILRIRTDLADKWLGNGALVSQQNFFPSPAYDKGLESLLKNRIFKNPFEVPIYV